MDEHQKELLKNLPKIDEMMLRIEKRENLAGFPREIVKEACRSVVEEIRGRILADRGKGARLRLPTPEQAADRAAEINEGYRSYRLRRVINATGVILHTNLGRAPLCRESAAGSWPTGERERGFACRRRNRRRTRPRRSLRAIVPTGSAG